MNKRAMAHVAIVLGLIILIAFIIISVYQSKSSTSGKVVDENSLNKQLPLEIANLPEFNAENLSSYESYESSAQVLNDLIDILNNQKIFNVPRIMPSHENYDKVCQFVTEYGPLIENYNDVVGSAKEFNKSESDGDLEKFYGATGRFAFELTLISGAVFYTSSYKTVGEIYRASGLQVIAPKCAGCVRVALSNGHWAIRNGLVELSSQFSKTITEKNQIDWNNITVDSLKKDSINFIKKGQEVAGDLTNKTITAINEFNYTNAANKVTDKTNNLINEGKNWLNSF